MGRGVSVLQALHLSLFSVNSHSEQIPMSKNGAQSKWLVSLFDRNFQYSEPYFWKNSCLQLCKEHDSRSCNEHSCPINCRLTEFGPWSICSPCVQKQVRLHHKHAPIFSSNSNCDQTELWTSHLHVCRQFRTRSILTPSQFGGSACSVELMEERPCHSATQCKLAEVDCREKFQCGNGTYLLCVFNHWISILDSFWKQKNGVLGPEQRLGLEA